MIYSAKKDCNLESETASDWLHKINLSTTYLGKRGSIPNSNKVSLYSIFAVILLDFTFQLAEREAMTLKCIYLETFAAARLKI